MRSAPKPIRPSRHRKYDSYISSSSSRNIESVPSTVAKPVIFKKKAVNLRINPPSNIGVRPPKATHDSIHQSTTSSTNSLINNIILKSIADSKYNPQFNSIVDLTYIKPKKISIASRGFYILGVFVFILTVVLSTQAYIFNRQAKEQVDVLGASSNQDEQGTGDEPAESKPGENAFFSYQVDPEKPRYLRIPSQSISSRVKQLGINTKGAIDAPRNIHDVGWYDGSIMPGSKNGVSLILGHVSGKTMPGVFKLIKYLEVGEIIEIEKGNGETLKFKVEKVEEYPVDSIDMKKILYEVEKGTKSMRLMTCSGAFDSASNSYQSRTVVYTVPFVQ